MIRDNQNHIRPCACFECKGLPIRKWYNNRDEWTRYKEANAFAKCSLCGQKPGSHAGAWETLVGLKLVNALGSCPINKLQDNGIKTIGYKGWSSWSVVHSYTPK